MTKNVQIHKNSAISDSNQGTPQIITIILMMMITMMTTMMMMMTVMMMMMMAILYKVAYAHSYMYRKDGAEIDWKCGLSIFSQMVVTGNLVIVGKQIRDRKKEKAVKCASENVKCLLDNNSSLPNLSERK